MGREDDRLAQVLSRRRLITLLGMGSVAVLAGPQARAAGNVGQPDCMVTPAQTEGPYFVDERLNRSDIRSDPLDGSIRPGVPLRLNLQVVKATPRGCEPLAGAMVDIWHCDAQGVYSDARDSHFNTRGKQFLRGYQITNAQGRVTFLTIYPGWYPGRTVHIHFKVRSGGYEFTSQLYFDDTLTDRVLMEPPYASKGPGRLHNRGDGIFRDGGDRLMLRPVKSGDGYTADFRIGLQMT